MIVKVPIKWLEIAGNTVIAPDLRGVPGVEFSAFIDKNDTHIIVEVQGDLGDVTVPIFNSEEEAKASL